MSPGVAVMMEWVGSLGCVYVCVWAGLGEAWKKQGKAYRRNSANKRVAFVQPISMPTCQGDSLCTVAFFFFFHIIQ